MTCTTSQILTFLWRANGSPEPSVANPFTNVSDDAYYAKAAVWAHERGPVSGTVFDGSYTVSPSFPEAGSTVTVTPNPTTATLWTPSQSPIPREIPWP